jgi:hypothetical protein
MRGQWALAGGTIALSVLLLTVGRGSYENGRVEVTIVPTDAENLGCEGAVGALSCAGVAPLRPFVTTGGRLVALPGLFEEPRVADWLRRAPAPRERVRVVCRARRVALGVTLGIRFSASDPFRPGVADVAEIRECEVD